MLNKYVCIEKLLAGEVTDFPEKKKESFNILLKRIQPTPKTTKHTRGQIMKKVDKIDRI